MASRTVLDLSARVARPAEKLLELVRFKPRRLVLSRLLTLHLGSFIVELHLDLGHRLLLRVQLLVLVHHPVPLLGLMVQRLLMLLLQKLLEVRLLGGM